MTDMGCDYPDNILRTSQALGRQTAMGRGEPPNVDMDAFARRLTREHNLYVRTGRSGGFLIAYPDRPTEHWEKQRAAFPDGSYVLPILSIPTTARDVLLWITGRMSGKHSDSSLRA